MSIRKVGKFWKWGQMAALARAAGIRTTTISDILHRRISVSQGLALILERESLKSIRRKVSACAWVFNFTTKHPAFFGRPKPLSQYKRYKRG